MALAPKHPNLLKYTIAAQLHLVAAAVVSVAVAMLIYYCLITRPQWDHILACMTFGLTSIFVFGASGVYHFICDGFHVTPELRRWLRDIDHFAIYLFMAAAYTVFVLNVVAQPWSSLIITLLWIQTLAGVLYQHYRLRLPEWAQHRFVSTVLYATMIWVFFAIRLDEILRILNPRVVLWLVAGLLAYGIGAIVYVSKRPRLFENVFGYHEVWHLIVIVGYTFHYLVILSFYRQY